jgi:hypothetical protein
MDNAIMGTKNKAVTAYLPEDIEAKLAEYCLEHGLSRQGKKSGKEKAALGTGIIEVLRTFFDGETHSKTVTPVIDKKEIKKIVSKTLPSNVPTADWVKTEIQQAIATFKQELQIVPATSTEIPATTKTYNKQQHKPEKTKTLETKTEAPKQEPTKETPSITPTIPTDPATLILNQADLAKRLNSNPSTLSRHHKKGDKHFAQWSKAQDPDKKAWQYDSTKDKSKFFKPIQ